MINESSMDDIISLGRYNVYSGDTACNYLVTKNIVILLNI